MPSTHIKFTFNILFSAVHTFTSKKVSSLILEKLCWWHNFLLNNLFKIQNLDIVVFSTHLKLTFQKENSQRETYLISLTHIFLSAKACLFKARGWGRKEKCIILIASQRSVFHHLYDHVYIEYKNKLFARRVEKATTGENEKQKFHSND